MLIAVPGLDEVDVRLDPDPRVTRGRGSSAEPIADALRLGRPVVVPLTPELAEAEDDTKLAAFLRSEAPRARYARVHLACTFTPGERVLVRATLSVQLSRLDGLDDPTPVAWSLTPMRIANAVSTTTTLKLGAKAEFIEGSLELASTSERQEVFLEALGLQEPQLGWEFSRTDSADLRGTHPLAAVIRLPAGTQACGQVSLGASVMGRRFLIVPYRAALAEVEGARFTV